MSAPARVADGRGAATARPARNVGGQRPRLTALASLPARAPRTPFVLLVLGLLGGGLLALLLLNTALAQGSFRIHDLQRQTATLADRQQQLQLAVDALSTPDQLARSARRLGLVPVHNPGFLRLGDGRVLGNPQPAVRATTTTPATTTAGTTPATTATSAKNTKTAKTTKTTKTGTTAQAGSGHRAPPAIDETGAVAAPARRSRCSRMSQRRRATTTWRDASPVATTTRRTPPAASRARPRSSPPSRRPAARPRRPVRRLGRPATRLRAALVVLALIVTVFGVRLVQLQGLDAPAYAAQAAASRLRTVVLPATRGSITDMHGHALAVTVDGRTVYADPHHVTDPLTEAATLAPLLHLDAATIEAALRRNTSFVYIVRGITPALGQRVADLNLPGIGLLDEPRRIYPNGDLAANVIGFVGLDGTGLAGLEYADNGSLAGHAGRQTFQIGADGRAIPSAQRTERAAVPGSNLVLTLDRDIQWQAQREIARQVKATGSESGTVVVMDPRTGRVLALATAPTFNPSDPGAAPESDRGDRPALDIYEPGSTNKVITFAAALQTGAITPMTPVTVPPTLHLVEPHVPRRRSPRHVASHRGGCARQVEQPRDDPGLAARRLRPAVQNHAAVRFRFTDRDRAAGGELGHPAAG